MFNWFKSKQSLIPADVSKGMLTSNFVSFKVGEKLVIPTDMVCFIRFKDKTYKELTSETYALNKEFLLDLYTKQLKGRKKLKELKADLYFVNLSSFSYEFEYADKLPLNSIKSKILFNIHFSVNVSDAKTFLHYIIYENTAPTSMETQNLTIQFVESCVRKFYLKRKLTSTSVSAETKQELYVYTQKQLAKIGVSLNSLEIKLFKKVNKGAVEEDKVSNFFDRPTKLISETKKVEVKENKNAENEENKQNLVDPQTEMNYTEKDANTNICPQCKSKMITNSIYCHKCGYRK